MVRKEILKALQKTRKGKNRYDETDKGVFFGQYLDQRFVKGTILRQGDKVQVIHRDPESNVILA